MISSHWDSYEYCDAFSVGTFLITFHETKVESKRSEICCSIMRSPNRSSGFLQGLIKCKQILWMLNFLPFTYACYGDQQQGTHDTNR